MDDTTTKSMAAPAADAPVAEAEQKATEPNQSAADAEATKIAETTKDAEQSAP